MPKKYDLLIPTTYSVYENNLYTLKKVVESTESTERTESIEIAIHNLKTYCLSGMDQDSTARLLKIKQALYTLSLDYVNEIGKNGISNRAKQLRIIISFWFTRLKININTITNSIELLNTATVLATKQ